MKKRIKNRPPSFTLAPFQAQGQFSFPEDNQTCKKIIFVWEPDFDLEFNCYKSQYQDDFVLNTV